ncbi:MULTISPECIES: SGNH/GDSL hydrolase family protein [Actinoalloteichus]|uniref:GDSL-like Lipase/Acylhydrolase family n=1 Tax=Actinoalloteichus fjordicus TaxID=1612552 RepID=A0AAC9LH86_9PSEU|nr:MULTISPECIES: SGNH/GDSL hydrolase family protein [Actinoalloteichus]APU16742.1 GDSL-like Lipase/Acylhydrolase family [Actinoalloteichus fjordicus]APU22808.1 GDSL-like Lipase/Acylhydrolase family [Actinoalloteichus sp. GBA129-24]
MRFARIASAFAGALIAVSLGAPAASAEETAPAAPVDYVALGDSYASGTGIGDYDPDSGSCLRSPGAYPELWAAANEVSSFTFAACSGAVTDDVVANQLGGLDADTDLVSISIGGNDAGFVEVITTCTILGTAGCRDAAAEANAYIQTELPAQLDATYAAIRSAAPNSSVVVLGYPRLFHPTGACILSQASRALLNDTADLLADVTAARAGAAGFTYADVRTQFDGHGVCASTPWINSIAWPINESFHPNAVGHAQAYLPAFSSVAPSSTAVLAAG